VVYDALSFLLGLPFDRGRAISQADKSPASNRSVLGSIPGHVMRDFRRTKWHWGRISVSTSVSSANFHSTEFTMLIHHPGLVQ
jgi:hypothetical protein